MPERHNAVFRDARSADVMRAILAIHWPEDVAILDSGVVRPMRPNQRVLHLRHAHSYFLVYKWGSRKLRSPLCP